MRGVTQHAQPSVTLLPLPCVRLTPPRPARDAPARDLAAAVSIGMRSAASRKLVSHLCE